MSLRIERWAGQAGVAEQLAAWHVREWQAVFPEWTVQDAVAEFNMQLLFSELPATWLAFKDQQLVGSISALLEDSPELKAFPGPWLASFYIAPAHRGQGAAQALMSAATAAVADYGHAVWYLFTPAHAAYYQRYGWQILTECTLHGETVAVMQQALPHAIGAAPAALG